MNDNEIERKVEKRAQKMREMAGQKSTEDHNKMNSVFKWDCIRADSLGDGIMYSTLHQNVFICTDIGIWLRWQGHHFAEDRSGLHKAAVENVVKKYQELQQRVMAQLGKDPDNEALQGQVTKITKSVKRLRTTRGRDQCIDFALHNQELSLVKAAEKLDQKPMLLACPNGVIDLRTGELHPGRQKDLLTKACPTLFKGINEPAPVWEETLHNVFDGAHEKISYFNRVGGVAVTGSSNEAVLIILAGQGRNGKTLIMGAFQDTLGSLSAPIPSEILLDTGRPRNSGGPSPDIMALKGLRLAYASETDEGRRFSPSKVKWLTGGDLLSGRNAYEPRETIFEPSHTLFLLTNHKPRVSPDDYAFWERVHLLHFPLSFVDREPRAANERRADKHLREKLRKEAPGILAWFVRGCLEYQEHGLDPPASVLEATRKYRRDEDLLADFIEECCLTSPEFEVGATDLFNRFETWWETSISKRTPKQRKFGLMMTAKGFKKEKKLGRYVYFGIK